MPAGQAGEGLKQDGSHPAARAGNSVTFLEPPQRFSTQPSLGLMQCLDLPPLSFHLEAITHTPGISLGSAGSPPVGPGPLGQEPGSWAIHWDPGSCALQPQDDGPTGAWPWLTSG